MKMFLEINIPIEPKGKARVRFARRGKFVATYNTQKAVDYEGAIAMYGRAAMQGSLPIVGGVTMAVIASMPIPSSWSKKKRVAAMTGEMLHIKKPDADNIAKAIADGLNTIVFNDDCQIVTMIATKIYAANPGINVVIKEI
jgi:Holliday junction resolvase RusA-like endonuclease